MGPPCWATPPYTGSGTRAACPEIDLGMLLVGCAGDDVSGAHSAAHRHARRRWSRGRRAGACAALLPHPKTGRPAAAQIAFAGWDESHTMCTVIKARSCVGRSPLPERVAPMKGVRTRCHTSARPKMKKSPVGSECLQSKHVRLCERCQQEQASLMNATCSCGLPPVTCERL